MASLATLSDGPPRSRSRQELPEHPRRIIRTTYQTWSERGAQFLTPPIDRGPETRCYLRDPEGNLIELGQTNRTINSTD
jgi:hypothetical protein